MPFGLPLATMISSLLVAKTTGGSALSPGVVSLSMFAVSAEANTSAGAPWMICATRAEDASKENVVLACGFAFANAAPMSLNGAVSDAAANTVMVPVAGGVVAAAAVLA